MDSDGRLSPFLRPGSKRPSPAPDDEEREVKKSRLQPCDGDRDRNILYDNDSFSASLSAEDLEIDLPQLMDLEMSPGGLQHGSSSLAIRSSQSEPLTGYTDTCKKTASLMDCDDELLMPESRSQETTLSATDRRQDDQSEVRKSQATKLPIQPSSASPSATSLDFCSDYDTCFGVVIAAPTSLTTQEPGIRFIPISLKPVGPFFLLEHQISSAYIGTLKSSRLVDAVLRFSLKLDGTVLISEAKDQRQMQKPKKKERTSAKSDQEYNIRIVLYGLRSNIKAIGDFLSEAKLFLQHPSTTEVIPGICYDNPHYLRRPHSEMPKLEHLRFDSHDDHSIQPEREYETSTSHFLQILEAAEADGRAVTVRNTAQSPRLRTTLMSHQITALAMMLEKESGYVEEPMFPPLWRKELHDDGRSIRYRHTITRSLEPKPIPALGGILSDDMGLGKSLSMLALICSSLDHDSTALHHDTHTSHRGTLIVAPKSTLHGWMAQISEHIHEEQIRAETYHGPNRKDLANQLQHTDIVITTYETLRSEWAIPKEESPIYSWKWLRVVLDEAHRIRNRSIQTFRPVCELTSRYRWCLTGTPIHNSLNDYGSLLSFIRVFPFTEKEKFKSWIAQPVEEKQPFSIERLQSLIRATCLRRLKNKVFSSDELKLPARFETIHEVHLLSDDQVLYDTVKKLATELVANSDKFTEDSRPKDKAQNILLLINSLRLICDHGEQLLSDVMKRRIKEGLASSHRPKTQQSSYGTCTVCGEIYEVEGKNFTCVFCGASEEGASNTNQVSDSGDRKGMSSFRSASSERPTSPGVHYRPSGKVQALLDNLKHEREPAENSSRPRKSVVFSYWIKMLDLIEMALSKEQFCVQRIDGNTSLEGRQKAMQEFNNSPDCAVMLASIGSAAEGVNLTAACTVHLIEPHWNPMVEAQAVDRVYRIGQTQDVTVIRYIVPGSVETVVQKMQDKKKAIINQAMDTNSTAEVDSGVEKWKTLKSILE